MLWRLACRVAALCQVAAALSPAWHEGLLRFECQPGCADCCKVSGDVWLSASEATTLLAATSLAEDACMDVRLEGGWRRLRRRAEGCILLTADNRCSVYAARPTQCRTYPFWPRVVRSREAWLAEPCPGIGQNATVPDASARAEEFAAWLRRFPGDAAAAVDDVERWARLAADLGLCPWARPALDGHGTLFVHSEARTIDHAFKALVDAAQDLDRSTRPDRLAIVFVVFPDLYPDDFDQFRRLLDSLEDDHFLRPRPDRTCLADDAQLAGFHPGWTWAGLPLDDPLHFEKRSPHPTISLVRAAAIRGADHLTSQIADDNRRILTGLGTAHLQSRFAACRPPPRSSAAPRR